MASEVHDTCRGRPLAIAPAPKSNNNCSVLAGVAGARRWKQKLLLKGGRRRTRSRRQGAPSEAADRVDSPSESPEESPTESPDDAAQEAPVRAVSAPPSLRQGVALDWPMSREEKKSQVMRLYNQDLQVAGGLLQSNEKALEALQAELDLVRQADTNRVQADSADSYRQAVESAAAVLRAVLQCGERTNDKMARDTAPCPRARSEGNLRDVSGPVLKPALSRTPRTSRCGTPKKRVSFGDRPERLLLSDSDEPGSEKTARHEQEWAPIPGRRSIAEPEPEEPMPCADDAVANSALRLDEPARETSLCKEGLSSTEPNQGQNSSSCSKPVVLDGQIRGSIAGSEVSHSRQRVVNRTRELADNGSYNQDSSCQPDGERLSQSNRTEHKQDALSTPGTVLVGHEHWPGTDSMVSRMREISVPCDVQKLGMNIKPKQFPLPAEGVLVNSVVEGGWSHTWDIRAGDVIVAMGGLRLPGLKQEDFLRLVKERPLKLIVERPPPSASSQQ